MKVEPMQTWWFSHENVPHTNGPPPIALQTPTTLGAIGAMTMSFPHPETLPATILISATADGGAAELALVNEDFTKYYSPLALIVDGKCHEYGLYIDQTIRGVRICLRNINSDDLVTKVIIHSVTLGLIGQERTE